MKLLLALFTSLITSAAFANLATGTATVSMTIPISASITKLDNITLTSTDGLNYAGSDTYTLTSNGQVQVVGSITTLDLGADSITPSVNLDSLGTSYTTTADSTHFNESHIVEVNANVTTDNPAGVRSATLTLTVSAL